MATPAFGFSVGDFVTVAALIWKLCKALSDASEDSKFFRDVQVELFAFNNMIIQLQESIRNVVAFPEERWLVVKKTLEQTRATVEEFGRYVDSFKACPRGEEDTQAIVKWKKKVMWSLSGEKKVKNFRESMQSYSLILTLTLQSFNNLALRNLDLRLTTEARDLSLQLQRNTDDIRSQVNRAIEEPWDQRPTEFQDAKGRRAQRAINKYKNRRGCKNQDLITEKTTNKHTADSYQEPSELRDDNASVASAGARRSSRIGSKSEQSSNFLWLSGLQPISPDKQFTVATSRTPITTFRYRSPDNMGTASYTSKASIVTSETVSSLASMVTSETVSTSREAGTKGNKALSWENLRVRRISKISEPDTKFDEIQSHLVVEPLQLKFKDTAELRKILQDFLKNCEKSRPNKDSYDAVEDLSNKINAWKPKHRLTTITKQDFDIDIVHCRSSNEAVIQRTIMISVIDRWQLHELFTFNCESQWKLRSSHLLPTTGRAQEVTLPKPDLAIFFKFKALAAANVFAPYPYEIGRCLRPAGEDEGCFPFFFMEVKKVAGDLESAFRANLHSASQALYNIYIWMSQAHQEEIFFRNVRVFSMTLNAQEINLRMHRAVPDGQDCLSFHFVDIESLVGYSKDQACHLVRNVLVEYAEKELHGILESTFQEVSREEIIRGKLQNKRKADMNANHSSKKSRSRIGLAVSSLPDQVPTDTTSSFGASGLNLRPE